MKPLKKYCYSIFFISLLSSTSFANPNSNNQVLLGYGIDDSSVDLPLLLSSNETGEHWSYSSAIFGLPSTANFNGQSAFHSIACTESFCTISGFQNLLLISQNKGLSWSTINNIQNLPASFKSYDISCADKNSCTIVGSYFRASGSYPVLLTTHDSGNSWLANNDISHNPGILSHVSCSDKTCVAAGNVSNAKKLPYILASQDSGNSWTEIKNINGISSIKNPFITDIDCNKNICTASGYYTLNSARMPLLLTSNDKGMSWSAVDINTPNGMLNKVTCTDTNCIATGTYQNQNAPMILVSNDTNKSWSLIKTIEAYPTEITGIPISIDCLNNECTIAGNYDSAKYESMPFTLISHDKGQSWTYFSDFTGLPIDNDYFLINDFKCNKTFCTMAGTYAGNNDAEDFKPLLITSTNHGKSWTVVKNINNMPELFNGSFYGIAN